MKFTLEIDLANAAFRDLESDEFDPYSLSGIVQNLVEPIESGRTSGTINDYNGNPVGKWEITS